MRIINDGSNDTLFTIDGIPYRKSLYELFYNEEFDGFITIGIRDIYNHESISSPIFANEYQINSETFDKKDIIGVVDSLSLVLGFNKGGSGGLYFNDGFII